MPEKELTLIQRVVHTVRLGGLWFGTEKDKVHTLGKISMVSFLSIYVLQLVALVLASGDADRMFECFSVIFFCGMGILKLLSLYRNINDWLFLLNRMELLEKDQGICKVMPLADQPDEVEKQAGNSVQIYTEKFKRTSIVLQRIYGFTVVIYVFMPFIEYGILWFLGSKPHGYPHVLPYWNPLDEKHLLVYVVSVLVEVVAAVYCVAIHTAFDSAVIGVMIFVCGQFSALKLRCSAIGGKGRSYTPSRLRDTSAHLRIVKCYSTHMLLVRSIEDLDNILRRVLWVYFFIAALTLCMIAMRLTSAHMTVMQVVLLMQYMCGILTQLFLYCSYGNALSHESSVGPGEGPFCAATWCLGPKVRREVAILGFGMMLPRKLHAGPFNTLDLPTFIQIVRAAYSYYAVLGKTKA